VHCVQGDLDEFGKQRAERELAQLQEKRGEVARKEKERKLAQRYHKVCIRS
jgi:hypothetical protein